MQGEYEVYSIARENASLIFSSIVDYRTLLHRGDITDGTTLSPSILFPSKPNSSSVSFSSLVSSARPTRLTSCSSPQYPLGSHHR